VALRQEGALPLAEPMAAGMQAAAAVVGGRAALPAGAVRLAEAGPRPLAVRLQAAAGAPGPTLLVVRPPAAAPQAAVEAGAGPLVAAGPLVVWPLPRAAASAAFRGNLRSPKGRRT